MYFCSISGAYIDKKCPFTGSVSIRGRILAGTCHSTKMQRTIIVRCTRRGIQTSLHMCHPVSVSRKETTLSLVNAVRFNVLKVIPVGAAAGGKKAFAGI
uniref:Small ribosomal subunit protein uS17 N-terminal domain-containing protein n=1 Tax=Chenopodium quinoa TaxID=63459 RepID=A0A803N640_CHEQI